MYNKNLPKIWPNSYTKVVSSYGANPFYLGALWDVMKSFAILFIPFMPNPVTIKKTQRKLINGDALLVLPEKDIKNSIFGLK